MLSLDIGNPNDVPRVLESAADRYRDAAAELAGAWQDRTAGAVWSDYAAILDRAAAACRRALMNRLG
jgi:hypothetical protein